MSMLKEAWEGLQAVVTLTDHMERHDHELEVLQAEIRNARERLVAIETLIAFSRGQTPRLPE